MDKFTIRLITFFIISILTACGQTKIKVIADKYSNGKSKTVWYFHSKADSKEKIDIKHSNGTGTVNKPLNFLVEGYYENGKLEYKGQYIKGQTSGLWEYFYETGRNEAKCYYNEGKSTDTVFCWYPIGKLKRQIVEIDTAKNYWRNIDYFENGNNQVECYQLKDTAGEFKLNGLFQEWFENGQLKFSATFKDSWTIGKWRKYELNGKLKEESDKPFSMIIK